MHPHVHQGIALDSIEGGGGGLQLAPDPQLQSFLAFPRTDAPIFFLYSPLLSPPHFGRGCMSLIFYFDWFRSTFSFYTKTSNMITSKKMKSRLKKIPTRKLLFISPIYLKPKLILKPWNSIISEREGVGGMKLCLYDTDFIFLVGLVAFNT